MHLHISKGILQTVLVAGGLLIGQTVHRPAAGCCHHVLDAIDQVPLV